MDWPTEIIEHPSVVLHGWTLESAEERVASTAGQFDIPSRADREQVRPGQGVKLLFHVRDEAAASLTESPLQVERMWCAVLDLQGPLERYTRLVFGPEDIADIYTGDTGWTPDGESA